MLFSSLFHLFFVVSERAYSFLVKLDYSGIAILICGSMFPPVVYGYWCVPAWMKFYLILTTTCCGACLVVSMSPAFTGPTMRWVRISSFICTAASGALPLGHLLLSSQHQYREAAIGIVVQSALYVGGALLYAARWPERLAPGKFDLIGASHQIFHVAVFLAALVHAITSVDHYMWRTVHSECSAY